MSTSFSPSQIRIAFTNMRNKLAVKRFKLLGDRGKRSADDMVPRVGSVARGSSAGSGADLTRSTLQENGQ